MNLRLNGRVALVTGSGRGIGAAIARRLAAEGAAVAVVDLDRDDAVRTAADLPGSRGYGADVADLDQLRSVVDRVHEEFGRFDILVNNAGITRDRTLRKMEAAEWDEVIRINLTGVWNGCKAAQPHLLEAGPTGRIISLSSTSYLGNFGQVNYAASKAGVVGLTRTLALEMARAGVTVNAIAPGFIDTAMTRAMPAEVFNRVVASVPLGRPGQPEDVAAAAAFLASDDAAYVTGQVVFVCGGYSVGAGHP
ncbi:MAG: beta-ketoacyl-ACP reductase [Anaerolinea sp.]|nr:beta-ketoacyl-ACP reductase [Anaerolinea sp.]